MILLSILLVPALLLASLVLLGDQFHQDPRPTCISCDQPRPDRYLADGVCVVCRAPAPARTQLPGDVTVDVAARRAQRHRVLAAQARHREDLRRQRAGLRALLAEVEDQITAGDEAAQAGAAVLGETAGGAR